MQQNTEAPRAALCIVYRQNNFGGLLQSLATVDAVEKRGFRCEILQYKKRLRLPDRVRSSARLLNRVLWNDLLRHAKRKWMQRLHPEYRRTLRARYARNDAFRAQYFTCPVNTVTGWNELCAAGREYDLYLTGSDQLWSPAGLPTNFYNLMFTAADRPRVSYSSSFGVAQIPWYQKRRTRAYLTRFRAIAMRENSGAAIVHALTGCTVPVVADPALLPTAAEWDRRIPPRRVVPQPYIFAYLLGTSAAHRQAVRDFAAQCGLPVVAFRFVDEYHRADRMFGDIVLEDAGAAEFLNAVRFADYVITDSFHGTVFSVLYHRPFVVLNRYANGAAASKNTRIDSLCANLGLEQRHCTADAAARVLAEPIDFAPVETRLTELRARSNDYLDRALGGIVPRAHDARADCCGCGACAEACPVHAIEMAPDSEGFAYPHTDAARCTHCGRCRTVCPMKPRPRSEAVPAAEVVRNRDEDVLRDSTSGGAFSALAEPVLRAGGVVYGAAFDAQMRVRHAAAETRAQLAALRGSKFVQSDLTGVYASVAAALRARRPVLFSGTPCQVEALQCYLGSVPETLVCADVVCRGAASPGLWARYCAEMERRFGARLRSARFRSKTYGYHSSTMRLEFENGKIYQKSGRVDPMMRAFVRDMASRPACAHCPMKHRAHAADLTMFDCKHYTPITGRPDDDRGYTSLLIHTAKGRQLLEAASGLTRCPAEPARLEALNGIMMRHSAQPNPHRDEFYQTVAAGSSVQAAVQRFLPVRRRDVVIEAAKKPLYALGWIDFFRRRKKKEMIHTQS